MDILVCVKVFVKGILEGKTTRAHNMIYNLNKAAYVWVLRYDFTVMQDRGELWETF